MESITVEKEFSPQYQVSLVEQITEFLTNAIIEGRLVGGQRLIENELQRRFGISRAPIRESFRILERNGLVITHPRKGTFVRKIIQKDIEENFPIRASLESLAARLAVPNLQPLEVEEMELALLRMTEEAKKNDFKSYLKHHSKYHEIFIHASKNDTLIRIIEDLRRQVIWFRFSYLYIQESSEYAFRVHREILNLFIKRDVERVEALVKEHILFALDRFLKFLASKNEGNTGG
jgi:DNA-binding GntR family transcriptional regulator